MSSKKQILTKPQLLRAQQAVVEELQREGFWTPALGKVDVRLTRRGMAKGYFSAEKTDWYWKRLISIPAIRPRKPSSQKRKSIPCYTNALRDIIRHEYAHALADAHLDLLSENRFARVFGAAYTCDDAFEYSPEWHVTKYAATNTSEDFAEVFMLYLKYKGYILKRFAQYPAIVERFRFMKQLARAIRRKQSA
ncbi:MAG: hypothetical protein JXA52_06470 [Planctomycetes bacterium]|nr:hypothetical protein [Planctomycetota bacterium]